MTHDNERALMLRTLKLNMIPAPRVITPGPATLFPIIFESIGGNETLVGSLKEARTGSWGNGFFRERPPVTKTCLAHVDGFAGSCDVETLRVPAIRAAYCLGFDSADVEIGIGPGGPWMLDVRQSTMTSTGRPSPSTPRSQESPEHITFAGARIEYLRVCSRTGKPEHKFHTVDIPEAPPATQAYVPEAGGSSWTASPMPFPQMPLATYLRFRGAPYPQFIHLFDTIVAVLAMLVSPVGESRERHATDEGKLGSVRLIEGGFEYQTAPSLLWNPAAQQGLIAIAEAMCEAFASDHRLCENSRPPVESWPGGQIECVSATEPLFTVADVVRRYEFQKAYYACDKAFFLGLVKAISGFLTALPMEKEKTRAVAELLRMAQASASGVDEAVKETHRAESARMRGFVAPSVNLLSDEELLELDLMDTGQSVGGPMPKWRGDRPIVLGIMSPLEDDRRRFGIETDRFKELIKIATEQEVLAYVFFPGDEDGSQPEPLNEDRSLRVATSKPQPTINAWFYRERRGWFQSPAPMPDVVYDRHVSHSQAGDPGRDPAHEVARRFSESHPQIPFVNSLPFVDACKDKLLAHRILGNDTFLRSYLPETIPAEDPKEVVKFAESRRTTYLKLRSGSGSRGIVVIENLGSGSFRVSNRSKELGTESTVVGTDDLHSIAAVNSVAYIAQHGIDLAKAPGIGDVFEVRVVCQKGGAGKWLRTGMVCRVSPTPDRFMVPREELHFRVDDLLGRIFPHNRVLDLKDEIREIARRIPFALEAGSGRGGEMSVDIGIDTSGRPYLIEVNSKPATLFRDIAAFELRRLSLRRIVNYSIELVGSARCTELPQPSSQERLPR